jgi:hypothetical protein
MAMRLRSATEARCAGDIYSDVSSRTTGELCGLIESAAAAGVIDTSA